ncbi:hypothetical protein CAPTEDRAFT_216368 [Capitella teleta]|uniref:Uncharacterized protein n=1 Tax=Capitella teleta TaxID=283909 RepID=R7U0S1_CAPTE|nr:hypothetical protein CAPTEDRAFT_216368 [Capitella teleta]|eukprot:ELT99788.1 hypothetical protein CAPTEDRAFT_216368 [Capitella teleta]
MAGWFAPPINQYVHRVRLAGPIALLFGLVLLICACLMCAVLQGRCCVHCVHLFQEQKSVLKAKLHHHHHPHHFNHSNHVNHYSEEEAGYVFDSGDDIDGYQRGHHPPSTARPATLIIREQPTCVVNQNACEISPQRTRKNRQRRTGSAESECGYHLVEHPLASPEVVIPCPSTPHVHSCHDTCSYQAMSPPSAYVNRHTHQSPSKHFTEDSPRLHRHNALSTPPQNRHKETSINGHNVSPPSPHRSRTAPGLGYRSGTPAQQPFSAFVFTRQASRHQTSSPLTHDVGSWETGSRRPSPYEIHSDV